jgi:hypothetical protein
MAEISFTGNKKLKSINIEWCTKFPFTYLNFIKADGKSPTTWDITHSSIRGKKGADEISTNASMLVSTFESRYEAAYGIKIQIKFIKGVRAYNTSEEHNKLTLSELNTLAKERKGTEVMKLHPEWFK